MKTVVACACAIAAVTFEPGVWLQALVALAIFAVLDLTGIL